MSINFNKNIFKLLILLCLWCCQSDNNSKIDEFIALKDPRTVRVLSDSSNAVKFLLCPNKKIALEHCEPLVGGQFVDINFVKKRFSDLEHRFIDLKSKRMLNFLAAVEALIFISHTFQSLVDTAVQIPTVKDYVSLATIVASPIVLRALFQEYAHIGKQEDFYDKIADNEMAMYDQLKSLEEEILVPDITALVLAINYLDDDISSVK